MVLSSDYRELRRQISYVNKKLLACKSKSEYVCYFENYKMLCTLYKSITGEDILDMSHPKKRKTMYYYNKFHSEVVSDFYSRFYQSREYSYDLFKRTYFDGISAYIDSLGENREFLDISNYKELGSEEEALEIIYSFFDEEFSERRDLLDSFLASGRLFDVSSSEGFSRFEGSVLYNSAENKGNAFFRKPLITVSGMSTFVHEMGHLIDCEDLKKIDPKLLLSVVGHNRVDAEFVSYYMQFKFLEYLIKNNIYREDAISDLSINIGSLLFHLENGYFVSMADDRQYQRIKYGFMTKGEYVDQLMQREPRIELPMYLAGGDLNYGIALDETISCSYGLVMACVSDDTDVFSSLMASRGNNDVVSRLDNAGVSFDVAAKQLVKKIDVLYK